MKDARGHGSDSRGGGIDVIAAARRAGAAAHQSAVRDVGRLKAYEGVAKDAVRIFAHDESARIYEGSPIMQFGEAAIEHIAMAHGVDISHLMAHLRA